MQSKSRWRSPLVPVISTFLTLFRSPLASSFCLPLSRTAPSQIISAVPNPRLWSPPSAPEPQVADKLPMEVASDSHRHRINKASLPLLIFRHTKPPCHVSSIRYRVSPLAEGSGAWCRLFPSTSWNCRNGCVASIDSLPNPLLSPITDGPWPRSV